MSKKAPTVVNSQITDFVAQDNSESSPGDVAAFGVTEPTDASEEGATEAVGNKE